MAEKQAEAGAVSAIYLTNHLQRRFPSTRTEPGELASSLIEPDNQHHLSCHLLGHARCLNMSSSASSSGISAKGVPPTDAVTRNALRYTISAKEYALLHKYLLSRAPAVRKRTPAPQPEASSGDGDDYNASTVRITVRLFLISFAGLKGWEAVSQRLLGRAPAP